MIRGQGRWGGGAASHHATQPKRTGKIEEYARTTLRLPVILPRCLSNAPEGEAQVSGEQTRMNSSFSSHLSPPLDDSTRRSTPRPHKEL